MIDLQVTHNKRAARQIIRAYRVMPRSVVRPAVRRTMLRHMRSVRYQIAADVARREGIKLRFLRRVMNIKVFNMKAVFWIVHKNWRAIRMGGTFRQKVRRGNVTPFRVFGGTLRQKRILPDGTFGIPSKFNNKLQPMYRDNSGNLRKRIFMVAAPMRAGYLRKMRTAPQEFNRLLLHELRVNMRRYVARLRRGLARAKGG